MQLDYPLRTPHASQEAAFFATGEFDEILSDPVAAEDYDNEEIRHFHLPPEQNVVRTQ